MLLKTTRTFILLLVAVLMLTPLAIRADEVTVEDPLIVWTSGQVDVDKSVYYAVMLVSGPDELKDLTITSTLPEGATFAKEFRKPEAAAFIGEEGGAVSWTLDALPAGTIIGPFIYQVTFANAEAQDFQPPATVKAAATYEGGEAEAELSEEVLVPLAQFGNIQVDDKGTADFVAVGDTGIWVNIPAGALSTPAKLTFERLPIDETAALPEIAEDTWWCALVKTTSDVAVEFTQPIMIILPTRRAMTPGSILPVFGKTADGEYTLLSSEDPAAEAPASALVGMHGTSVYLLLNNAKVDTAGMTLATGQRQIDLNISSTSITSLNLSPMKAPGISDPAPWF